MHKERHPLVKFAHGLVIVGLATNAACEKIGSVNPTVTQDAEKTSLPTVRFGADFLRPPEAQGEPFDGFVIDSEDGRVWRMYKEDFELVGESHGEFQGWVDESSIPEDEKRSWFRWGRWINREGMGIVRFVENGTVFDDDGGVWQMIPEDYELVGNYPGTFNGWVPDSSIPEDEREEGVRWGLWSNKEGQGRLRFIRIDNQVSVEVPSQDQVNLLISLNK